MVLDAVTTLATTTRRGTTRTSETDLYTLVTPITEDEYSSKTYILRLPVKSENYNKVINSINSSFVFIDVEGELQNLAKVEKMDTTEQIVDVFNKTINDIEDEVSLEKPGFLINANFKRDTLLNALIPTYITSGITSSVYGNLCCIDCDDK